MCHIQSDHRIAYGWQLAKYIPPRNEFTTLDLSSNFQLNSKVWVKSYTQVNDEAIHRLWDVTLSIFYLKNSGEHASTALKLQKQEKQIQSTFQDMPNASELIFMCLQQDNLLLRYIIQQVYYKL